MYQRGFPSTADRRCNSAMVFLGRGGQPVVGRETRPENRVKSSDIDSVDVVTRSAGQHFVAMAFKRKFGDQEREADKTSLTRKRFLFCCPCYCSDLVCPTALIIFLFFFFFFFFKSFENEKRIQSRRTEDGPKDDVDPFIGLSQLRTRS